MKVKDFEIALRTDQRTQASSGGRGNISAKNVSIVDKVSMTRYDNKSHLKQAELKQLVFHTWNPENPNPRKNTFMAKNIHYTIFKMRIIL